MGWRPSAGHYTKQEPQQHPFQPKGYDMFSLRSSLMISNSALSPLLFSYYCTSPYTCLLLSDSTPVLTPNFPSTYHHQIVLNRWQDQYLNMSKDHNCGLSNGLVLIFGANHSLVKDSWLVSSAQLQIIAKCFSSNRYCLPRRSLTHSDFYFLFALFSYLLFSLLFFLLKTQQTGKKT